MKIRQTLPARLPENGESIHTAPKKPRRKPALAVLAVLALMAGASVTGATGAYLTDKASATNDITMGNIVTSLTEPKWDANTEKDRTVWPGRTVAKDPTVTNLSESSSPCFAYLIVTTPIDTVRTYDPETKLMTNDGQPHETELVTYLINDGWTELEKYQVKNRDTIQRVFAYNTELAPGESTVPLFDEIKYSYVVEGDIPMDTTLEVPVQMVTIQSEYLADGKGNVVDTPAGAYDIYVSLQQ